MQLLQPGLSVDHTIICIFVRGMSSLPPVAVESTDRYSRSTFKPRNTSSEVGGFFALGYTSMQPIFPGELQSNDRRLKAPKAIPPHSQLIIVS